MQERDGRKESREKFFLLKGAKRLLSSSNYYPVKLS